MAFSRWMAVSVKITWINFKKAYFNMVISTLLNSPEIFFSGFFWFVFKSDL